MSFTKRTCHKCGYRDIQPRMTQKKVEIDVGSSSPGMSTRAIIGSTLGAKKSSNQVSNWLTGSGKRNYKRNRIVWLCEECAHPSWYRPGGILHTLDVWLWKVFKIFAIWGGLYLFIKIMEHWSQT